MDLKQLTQEIKQRERNRQGIRESVQKYAFEKYGIVNLLALVDEALGEPESFEVCLARQLATANTEHMACSVFAAWLSRHMDYKVTGRFLSFSRDTYFPNPYKRSLVRLPQLKRGRKGPFLHYEKVASPCQGQILSQIFTTEGDLLPAFHQTMRNAVSTEQAFDLSGFFQTLVKKVTKSKPSHVYLANGNQEKKSFSFDLKDDVRPPAEWYYLPYLLSFFMDGRRGLLCTINSRRPGANNYFVSSINEIKRATGIEPLLILVLGEIPWQYEPRGEYIFPEVQSDWQSEIKIPSSSNLHEAFEGIEQQIFNLV